MKMPVKSVLVQELNETTNLKTKQKARENYKMG